MTGALLLLTCIAAPSAWPPPRADGLLCTLRSVAGGADDARLVDRVALYVAEGEPPSELLPAGPFTATWCGELQLDLRSKLRFAARGTGRAKLSLGGQVVFDGELREEVELASADARFAQGANDLLFEYRSPSGGAASVRLLWAGRDFDWEPIPPAVLHHDPQIESAELLARRRGRELFAERRCLRCHAPESAAAAESLASSGMPELAAAAPDLSDAGARLRRDWIAHWLVAPRSLRPTARMPRLLGAGDLSAHLAAGDTRALDLAAWLSSRHRQEGGGVESAVDPARADAGALLFARLGCIACHTRPDRNAAATAEPDAGPARIPLQRVAWKWQPAALVRFLRQPTADDPWIRMPDLHLDEAEATALAAFLITRSAANAAPPTPAGGEARRGEELYAKLACARCHVPAAAPPPTEAPPVAPSLAGLAQADWSARGCAAEPARRAAACPDLELDAGERAALLELRKLGLASLGRRNAVDFSGRQVRELQCNACHTIGLQRDRWQGLVDETQDLLANVPPPQLDQARPALTWIGEKLHTDWMRRLIAGEIAERTRPWLLARMPAFPARAELLARGLAERDGVAASAARPEQADAAMETVGRQLLFETGFSCISCHDVGARKALSRFEFGTPDLALEHARIRPDYYRRWMLNPMRVEPSSKMPRYTDDAGKSPFTEFFDGDIGRQFEAIRVFLAQPVAGQR